MNPACPACATATTSVELQEVPCFECGSCRGHFMCGEAVESFLSGCGVPDGQKRLIEQALQAAGSTRKLTCPACRAQSYRVVRSGLVSVDVCDICGSLYLDKGEADAYLQQTRVMNNMTESTVNAISYVVTVKDFLMAISRLFH